MAVSATEMRSSARSRQPVRTSADSFGERRNCARGCALRGTTLPFDACAMPHRLSVAARLKEETQAGRGHRGLSAADGASILPSRLFGNPSVMGPRDALD